MQPWEFVAVTDLEVLRRIANTTDYGKFIADAPVCVLVLCRDTKYYLEDGSAATENILLAARAHGLGSCWVAGDKKPYAAEICRLVGAPQGYKLISLIPIGYPAESPEKSKRPLSDARTGRSTEASVSKSTLAALDTPNLAAATHLWLYKLRTRARHSQQSRGAGRLS